MGLFSQSEKVRVPGQRGSLPKRGDYVIEVVKHAFKPLSFKDKQPLAILEYKVVEALEVNSENYVGETCAAFWKLETDRLGGLTQLGEINMGRLKAYVCELLGGNTVGLNAADITPQQISELFGQTIDEDGKEVPIEGWDGTDVAGIRIHLRVVPGVSKNGKSFTNLTFTALPAE